jgi:hypothetical protein
MTRIKQNTSKVHLTGDDGRAICGVTYPETVVELASWQAGFTPAALGSRICRGCEEKAGMGARYESGEKTTRQPTTWQPLDRPDKT